MLCSSGQGWRPDADVSDKVTASWEMRVTLAVCMGNAQAIACSALCGVRGGQAMAGQQCGERICGRGSVGSDGDCH